MQDLERCSVCPSLGSSSTHNLAGAKPRFAAYGAAARMSWARAVRLCAVWLVLGMGMAASAQTNCTVNIASDNAPGSGGSGSGNSGDLRYCITLANANSGGNIGFDATVFSDSNNAAQNTITLSGALNITANNVTVTGLTMGSGATLQNRVTVDGGGSNQILSVNGGVTGAAIANLNFADGNAYLGGAISNGGTLTVTNSIFSANSATNDGGGGAIWNSGTLTVTNSIFSANVAPSTGRGGAIANINSLTVTNSTFLGNTSAGDGGAVLDNGVMTLTDSTFFGNSSAGNGGAIYIGGTLTLTNSTFSANSAEQGGAIRIGAIATLRATNNIFSANSAASSMGGGFYNDFAGVTENNNIFYNNAGGDASGLTLSASDVTGKDPKLAPLGWYGGPTQTMILLPGSAAICAGSSSAASSAGVTLDQRGYALEPTCPAGAVDAGAIQTNQYQVNTIADSNDGSCTSTACSLRDALTADNAAGGDITFAPSLSGTIKLGAGTAGDIGLPAITGTLNLLGPGSNQVTISGNNDATVGTVLTVNGNAFVYGLTIANGNDGFGGAISNGGTLTVTNCAFFANSGAFYGGAIYNNGGTVTVTNCTFSANSVGYYGGAIDNNVGTLTVTDSTFSANSVTNGFGGAFYNNSGTLTLTNSTFSANSAGFGGAIFNGSTLTVTNSTFSANSAEMYGGAIFNGGQLAETSSIFSGNTALIGGGIDAYEGATTEGYNVFYNNAGGDISGSYATNIGPDQTGNPNLSALGWYGGPTQTMIPLNPVEGVYQPGEPTTDQRGAPRPTSGPIDIGAVQVTGNPPPTVTGISPSSGLPAGGASVIITGTYFTGASAVYFGATPATNFTVVSSTQITAVSPAGAEGTVDLTVTTPGGTSATSAADQFTYIVPIATLLTPTVTPSASYVYENLPPSISVALTNEASGAGIAGMLSNITATLDSTTALTVGYSAPAGNYSISLPMTNLTFGPHTITVSFAGTPSYLASGATITLTVTATTPSIVVNTTGDSGAGASDCTYNPTTTGAGNCTLRDALEAAYLAGGGNITFDSSVFSASNTAAQNTIKLRSGVLIICGYSVTITGRTVGSGATLQNLVTVDGGEPDTDGGTRVAIANLIFAHGSGGNGDIQNYGAMTVNNSTFFATSGVIGGAIGNFGTLTVNNSTFSANSVLGSGGAIDNSGTATVTNSTFSGNSAGAHAHGGAIVNTGTLTVTNSTFSANSAGGGGAIENGGTATVTNSIFTANSSLSNQGGGIFNTTGGTVAESNNIFYNNAGGDTNLSALAGSDVTGEDPRLAPLGNFGGPTQTMIPLPGSPAICAGSTTLPSGATLPATDQRGVTFGSTGAGGYCSSGSIDAGAVQTDYALSFSTDPPAGAYINTNFQAAVTLDENGSAFFDGVDSIPIPMAWTGSGTTLASAATSATTGIATYTALSSPSVVNNTLTASLVLNPAITPTAPAISATSSSVNITKAPSVLTLTSSLNPAFAQNGVTLTATVSSAAGTPSGSVTFYNGTTALAGPVQLSNGTATLVTSSLPVGADSLTVVYSGDASFTTATSNAVAETIEDFSLTIGSGGVTSATVIPGQAATFQFTVSPQAPATTVPAAINLAVTGLPAGATYTLTPSTLDAGAGAATVTLVVNTAAATAANEKPRGGLPLRAAPLALAVLALFGAGRMRRRGRQLRRMLSVAILLLCGAAATLLSGCGGGFFTQPPQNYTVTLTGAAGNLQHSTNVALNVQ